MARTAIPLTIPDLSAYARTLRGLLAEEAGLPSHLTLLGHLAKAAGYQNFQHLRAEATEAPAAPHPPVPTPKPSRTLERALRVFDDTGRMKHWPNQTSVQGLCLWAFWAKMPKGEDWTEPQVNAMLKAGNLFDDHVLLRRSLIDHGLVTRTPDGRAYRRMEQKPDADALALIRALA